MKLLSLRIAKKQMQLLIERALTRWAAAAGQGGPRIALIEAQKHLKSLQEDCHAIHLEGSMEHLHCLFGIICRHWRTAPLP